MSRNSLSISAMLRYLAVALVVCISLESAQADEYQYQDNVSQFLKDTLSMMQQGMKSKFEELSKEKLAHSRFTKAIENYNRAMTQAQNIEGCSTDEDLQQLQSFQQHLQDSMKSCADQPQCQDFIGDAVKEIVTELQDVDADGAQQKAACADDSCRLQVVQTLHESLMKVYIDSIPSVHTAVQQTITNTACCSAITSCMIQQNAANLQQIYENTKSLRACVTRSGGFGQFGNFGLSHLFNH